MATKDRGMQILELIGGAENVKSMTHCMTRLRFVLKDSSIVDDEKVKAIKGVMGVVRQKGQYQVIIGNDVVIVFDELKKFVSTETKEKIEPVKKEKRTIKGIFLDGIEMISACLTEILPAIVGCGMIKLLLTILDMCHVDGGNAYQILTVLGDTAFYFLPLLVAYVAAKKMNTNVILALVITAFLIHPTLVTMLADGGVTFLKIPVYSATYSASIFPPLFATWILSIVEPIVDKITPKWSKGFLNPMLTLLIATPIVLIVFAPLGAIIGQGLSFVFQSAMKVVPWLTVGIISAIYPLLVMTGMHYALNPIMFAGLADAGFDNIMLPAMLGCNLAQAAACFAVAIKSKNSELKSVSFSSGISAAVAGITEPAVFGVTFRLKKPMIACMIGAGISGIFMGFVNLKSYVLAVPSLISIIQFISPDDNMNIVFAIIAAILTMGITFVLTILFGFEDEMDEENTVCDENAVYAPVKGKIIPITEVKDETFAQKMLGDGVAIIPQEGKIYAPFDGKVEVVMDTGHAVALNSVDGIEMLIHVGLDTVKLQGKGFTTIATPQMTVKKGDLLLEFDREFLLKEGYDITTPVVITNTAELGEKLKVFMEKETVSNSDKIMEV